RSAKKSRDWVKVKDTNVSDYLPILRSSLSQESQIVVPESSSEESNVNLESGNDTEELKFEEAATKVQAAVRSHQAREELQKQSKGIVKLQAVIRGHLLLLHTLAFGEFYKLLFVGKKARSSETDDQLQKTNSYGPEDPNSAKVWLERWTLLQVWAPGPLVVKSLLRNLRQRSEVFKQLKQTRETEEKVSRNHPVVKHWKKRKPKRNVRKASTLGKEVSRTENDNKSKQNSRKSTSAVKEVSSSLEVKEEKPRVSLRKSSVSNGLEKPTRKSAEKKKEIADSVQKESPDYEVSPPAVDTPEEEKMKDSTETVCKEADLDKDENHRFWSKMNSKPKREMTKLKKRFKSQTSENGNDTKASDRRASLPAKIENHHQEEGLTHSGRKIPSYMAPTASAKARRRTRVSKDWWSREARENGITRRHSLPPAAANGKLNTMSPRAHRLLIASAKGSMNSDRSFSSSRDIGGDKSAKAEWKRLFMNSPF
ncbi:LOW QUALITY PROTEIN: hypothetical protein HID58_007957, partial [Brassica napus]